MLKEAIEKIVALSKSPAAKFVHVPGDPNHVRHRIDPDGTAHRIELDPGNRELTIERLTDLIALGKQHFDSVVAQAGRLLVCYDAHEVRLVFDHANGREYAKLNLTNTDEYLWFAERRRSSHVEVPDLRHALRVDIRKTYTDANLVDQVSSLSFLDTDQGGVDANRGRESLGRQISKAVADPQSLPDPYQTFSVRRYANPDLDVRHPVQCVLEPDLKTRRWFIRPLEDSWIDYNHAALDVVGQTLRDAFKDTGIPVYQGEFSQDQASPGNPT